MQDRTMSRSLKIAAAASAAGAACLSLGLFIAIAKDSRAGEDVAVWTVDGDDDVARKVRVINLSNADDESDEESATSAKRGYLGVDVREDTKSSEGGAYVNHVVKDSPADKGGLKDGDVIVGFGGDVVRGPAKLTQKIHETKPGDKVTLDVRRDGRVQKLSIEMGKRPDVWRMSWSGDDLAPLDEDQLRALEESLKGLENIQPQIEQGLKGKFKMFGPGGKRMYWFNGNKPILGVELVSTTPELREVLGGRKDAGVLVGKVIAGSAAEKAGVKTGDLILSVDGTNVSDPAELADAIQDREGKTVDLEVVREKRAMHLKAVLPKVEDEDDPQGPRAGVWRLPAVAPVPPVTPMPLRADCAVAFAPFSPIAPPAPVTAPAPPAPPTPPAAPAPAPAALPRTVASMFV